MQGIAALLGQMFKALAATMDEPLIEIELAAGHGILKALQHAFERREAGPRAVGTGSYVRFYFSCWRLVYSCVRL